MAAIFANQSAVRKNIHGMKSLVNNAVGATRMFVGFGEKPSEPGV